jgi:hypothetical protein
MTRTRALVTIIVVLVLSQIATGVGVGLLASRTSNAVTAIQQQRVQSCLDTDSRHDAATAALTTLLQRAETHDTPAARARASASQAAIQPLIDALAPERKDCATINNPPAKHKPSVGATGSTGPTGPVGPPTP